MLTRSGLGAVLTALVLAGLGWWWGYEELIVAAVVIGGAHAGRHLGVATPAAGHRHAACRRRQGGSG